MPTVYKDQFLRVDPGNLPPTGMALAVERNAYLDADNNGQVLQDGIYIARAFVANSTNMLVGIFGPACFTPDCRATHCTAHGSNVPEGGIIGPWKPSCREKC